MYTIENDKISYILCESTQVLSIIKPIKLQIALIYSQIDPTNIKYQDILNMEQAQLLKIKKEELTHTMKDFLNQLYDDLEQIQIYQKRINSVFTSEFSSNIENFRIEIAKSKQPKLNPQIMQLKQEILRLQIIIKQMHLDPNYKIEHKPQSYNSDNTTLFSQPQYLTFQPPNNIIPPKINVLPLKTLSPELELSKIQQLEAENQLLKSKNLILQEDKLNILAKLQNTERWAKKEVRDIFLKLNQ